MTIGVLFGGPTPEHDISILTGLQALRELSPRSGDVRGLYWTKTGAFVSVGADVEASAFVDGVPMGSGESTLRVGENGGFYATGARLGRDRPLDLEVIVLATHGGPGEDGTLQGVLDLAGLNYTGPTRGRGGPRDGQVVLWSLDGSSGAPVAAAMVAQRRHDVPTHGRPLHLEAALRRLLDRHRRGTRPRHGQGATHVQPSLRQRLCR